MGTSKKNNDPKNPAGFFFGLNTIDLQFKTHRYPSANTKTRAEATAMHVGGPATNAAVCFQWLGGKSELLTPIGKHSFQTFIFEELQGLNVEITDAAPDSNAFPTLAAVVSEQQKGTRTIVVSPPSEVKFTSAKFSGNEKPAILLIDGFYMEKAIHLANHYKNQQVPVILDGGSWKEGMDELLPLVDIAICAASFHPPGENTAKGVIEYLVKKGISRAAITRDADPVMYYENGNVGEIATLNIRAVDSLGAGDFFHGAFCYYHARGYSFTHSLSGACIVAGNSCKYFGSRQWMERMDPAKYQLI